MGIMEILLRSHTKNMTESFKNNIRGIILNELKDLNVDKVDLYYFNGEMQTSNIGKEGERFVIFLNTTYNHLNGVDYEDGELVINGFPIKKTKLLMPSGTTGNRILIESLEGDVIAEYIEDGYMFNILFDLHGDNQLDVSTKIFEYIMKQLNEKVFLVKKLQKSWLYTPDKEKFINEIAMIIKKQKEFEAKRELEIIKDFEWEVRDLQTKLKERFDKLYTKRKQYESLLQGIEVEGEQIIKDVQLVVESKKVKNMFFDNEEIIVITNPLIIHASGGTMHYGGSYRIEINMNNSKIKFFSDENNTRVGHWSQNDPHPHVSHKGDPCLGNVASTIAELCSQNQLYALVLICIDFLESANESDCAGKNVTRWDLCDEDGNIIEEGYPPEEEEEINYRYCPDCENSYDEDVDFNEVYERLNANGNLENENWVCDSCFDDYQHVITSSGQEAYVYEIDEADNNGGIL